MSDEGLERQRRKFAVDLAQMKVRAGNLGFWRTMQALDAATNAVGYELADIIQGKQADTVGVKHDKR